MENLMSEGKLNERFEIEPLEKRLLIISMCEFSKTLAVLKEVWLNKCKEAF